MKYFLRLICVFGLTLVLFSCKSDSKDSTQKAGDIPAKKELTRNEIKQVNSILTKAMITPELGTFVSTLVSSGLSDQLTKEEGPFTLLAPSNEAFGKIDGKRMESLLNQANKEQLSKLINSHIVKASLDSATLVQNIKEANGSYKIITMSGATYTASREGTDIVITDMSGAKATIGKSDISGSNGVLHVLDIVLSKT